MSGQPVNLQPWFEFLVELATPEVLSQLRSRCIMPFKRQSTWCRTGLTADAGGFEDQQRTVRAKTYIYGGFHKYGYPKWMVYKGKSY
jgi:hypothetical protein